MDNIKAFKLVTGDEVVAKITDNGDKYLFDKPLRIILVPSGDSVGMMLMNLLPYAADDTIEVSKQHIVFGPIEVEESMKNEYSKQTSTISIPPTKELIY